MKRFFKGLMLSFLFILGGLDGYAQRPSWEAFLEQRFFLESEGTEWENLVEELTALSEHPICINTATKEELEQLFFLSPKQIEDILFHIDYYGPVHQAGGLMLIPSLDYDTRRLLACFLTFDTPENAGNTVSLREQLTRGRSTLMGRMDIPFYSRAGYEPFTQSEWEQHPSRYYLGSPLYGSLRYAYHYRERLYWGLSAEKDAGEPGVDFFSGYVQAKDVGILHNITLGCYRLSFGQGLVMNTNFSMGKNFMLSKTERSAVADPISRHGGTNEIDFLRGLAATVRIGAVDVTGFVSHRRYDATLASDSVSTFLDTGKHRTSTERQKDGNVAGILAGGHIKYSWNGLHVGAAGLWQSYDHPLTNGHLLYKTYYPRGQRFTNWSADYAFYRRTVTFAGETAFSGNGGWATLNTLRLEPFDRVAFTLLHRHYARDYWGLQANAFGEGSEVRNEQGLYIGTDIQSIRHWRFAAYADLFRFPEPRYRVDELRKGPM